MRIPTLLIVPFCQLSTLLPGLATLSLTNTLSSEIDPVFRKPELAEQRHKTPEQVKRRIAALRKKKREKEEKAEEMDDESSDSDSDAGGSVPLSRAQKARKARYSYLGTSPHTSVAGWTALLRLPRGFYRLDVDGNELSYDSYALLRLHVADVFAKKVASPEEEAAAARCRSEAALKRAERAAEAHRGSSRWRICRRYVMMP